MAAESTICIVSESLTAIGVLRREQVAAESGFVVLQCGQMIMHANAMDCALS
jgi:hypothetical protein